MKPEEHEKFIRWCILGAIGGILMAAGDWLLGCIPLRETDTGMFNRAYYISGSYGLLVHSSRHLRKEAHAKRIDTGEMIFRETKKRPICRNFFIITNKKSVISVTLQLVDISKLVLNSKIKKFSYSFICGKGHSPPLRGENSFLSTV